MQDFIVGPENHGMRLDRFLVQKGIARGKAQDYIKQGWVMSKEKIFRRSSAPVHSGDTISIAPLESSSHEYDIPVIYEDEALLIIAKPAGILSHPGHTIENRPTVTDFLRKRYGTAIAEVGEDPARPGIVHRLDKDTSGLMLIAKNQLAFIALKKMVMERSVKRKYLALVYGHITPQDGTIKNHLARKNGNKIFVVKNPDKIKSREAITEYRTVQQWDSFSLIECSLITGRTHQIRVHMSHMKNSIVGDKMYGRNRMIKRTMATEFTNRIAQLKCHWLHAYQLELVHPFSKQTISLQQSPPEELQRFLDYLQAPLPVGH